MTDAHLGWVINTHYDTINMLTRMKEKNPQRFHEFDYSQGHIYEALDRLQQEQNLQD